MDPISTDRRRRRYRKIQFRIQNSFSSLPIKIITTTQTRLSKTVETVNSKIMGIRRLLLPRSELEFERHRTEKSRSNKNYETLIKRQNRDHHRHGQHRSSGRSSGRSLRGSSRRHKRRHKFFDQVLIFVFRSCRCPLWTRPWRPEVGWWRKGSILTSVTRCGNKKAQICQK